MSQLSPRRRKFASEYVQNGYNGVQAAIAAGYTPNYFAAGVTAHRLLKDAKIMDEIAAQSDVLSDDEILQEISSVAKAKVKLNGSDKMKGLEMLAKNRGLIKERIESTDLTQAAASEAALTKAIQFAAQRDDVSESSAACELYSALADDPAFANLDSWPAQYREVIRASLSPSQPITDIPGEQ